MIGRLKFLFAALLGAVLFAESLQAAPRIASKKKIVLVTSFGMRLQFENEFIEAFNASLSPDKFDVENISFSIEQNFNFQAKGNDIEWFLEKVNYDDVDAVVALDFSAIKIIRENFDRISGKPRIMLVGETDIENSQFVKDKSNVFLINKNLDFKENVRLGVRLMPDAKKIICLTDASEGGVKLNDAMQYDWADLRMSDFGSLFSNVEIEFINGSEYSTIDMMKKISQAGENAFVLFSRWFSVKDSGRSSQKYYVELVSEIAQKNIISFTDVNREKVIGGKMLIGSLLGAFTAEKTLQMLEGSLDDRNPEYFFSLDLMLNKEVFLKKKLSPSALSGKNVNFYNYPPSFWDNIGLEFAVVVLSVVCALLVLVFIISYKSMRAAARNSILFSNIPTNVYVFSKLGEMMYSYSEYDEFKRAKSFLEIKNEFYPIFKSKLEEMKKNEKISFEFFHEGKMRRAVVAKLPDSAFGPDAYIGTTLDITDLENARRKEREVSSHLSTTLSSIGDAVITTDEHEVITFINPVACELTGFSEEDAKGHKLEKVFNLLFNGKSADEFSAIRTAMETKEIVKVSEHLELVSKDGRRYHISNSVAPIIINGKLAGAVLVFRDISEEYRNLREMAAKNSLLNTATAMTGIYYFQCDKNWKISGDFDKNFLGSGGKGGPDEVLDLIIPEDREVFISSWKALLSGEKQYVEYSYRSDISGVRRHFHVHASPTPYEDEGDALYLVVIQEITSIKENEQRLQYANTMLKNILDNIPCSISVKNHSDGGKYVMVNSQFYNFLTVDESYDIVGKTASDLFDADTAAKIEKTDAELAKSGGKIDTVLSLSGKNGGIVKIRSIKVAAKMENGEIYIFSADLDITDLIRNQELLEVKTTQMGIINECLQRAMLLENIDDAFGNILQMLGNNLNIDRAYVYYFDDSENVLKKLSFWKSEEAPDLLDEIPEEISQTWAKQLNSDRYCRISNFQNFSEDHSDVMKDFAAKDKSLSFLLTGIYEEGKLVGIMGVDNVFSTRDFDGSDEMLLQSTSRIAEIIIERFRNLSKAKNAEEMRKIILNSVPIPIRLYDKSLNIISANSAAINVMGGNEDEIMNRSRDENLHFGGWTKENNIVLAAVNSKEGQKANIELDGREYLAIATPILDSAGEISHVVDALFDVTELNELNRQLMGAMRAAQEADRAKSNFLATMSHEIRTPLNAVIGYSELTQNSKLTQEERVHNLKNINFAANTLLSLINDILDFSKLETDNTEILKSPVDIAKLAKEFQGVFGYATRNKNISFGVEIPQDIPVLMMDALRLKQVLMNIVNNAVKFTKEGGVKLKFSFEKISDEKINLEISVKDTGIGISPQHLEKIFNPFVQEYTKRVRGRGAYEGTGLGLSIAKRLVEKMKGKISVESAPEKGSEFKIRFDDVEIYTDAMKIKEAKPPVEEPEKNVKSGLKVLIVDDVLLNIKVLAKMLRTLNVDVFDAISGAEALEKLKKDKPDAIMTDLWMPEMDGEEFAKKVREDPEMKNIPIILVTADTQMEDKSKVFDAILFKPISISGIVDVLKKFPTLT